MITTDSPILTTPAGKPLDTSSEPPKATRPDELTAAEKLEALRKANEERRKQAEAEDKEAEKLEALRNPPPSPPLRDARVDVASGKREEERAAKPRALRAIMDNGNVLKTIDWPWKRDPSEKEKDDFLRSVKHASMVDIVNGIA